MISYMLLFHTYGKFEMLLFKTMMTVEMLLFNSISICYYLIAYQLLLLKNDNLRLK